MAQEFLSLREATSIAVLAKLAPMFTERIHRPDGSVEVLTTAPAAAAAAVRFADELMALLTVPATQTPPPEPALPDGAPALAADLPPLPADPPAPTPKARRPKAVEPEPASPAPQPEAPAPAAAEGPVSNPQPPVSNPEPTSEAPVAAPEPAVDYPTVRAEILAVSSKLGRDAVLALLEPFGVKNGKELKPEQWAPALAAARQALAGGAA